MFQFEMGGTMVKCDTADELRSVLTGSLTTAVSSFPLPVPLVRTTRKPKAKGMNKSKEIRDYREANPTAQPTEIAAALATNGVKVSTQFVSTVLSNLKRKKAK